MKILIMAGGGGTRLWPLSRKNSPKQFHKLVGDQSLLQMTFERFRRIKAIKKQDIFVSTNGNFHSQISRQIPVPEQNIIFEPTRRDNSAAIGLSLISILHQTNNPAEVVGMFPSDHLIKNQEIFEKFLELGEKAAFEQKSIVTLGVRPRYPEIGFGYIEMSSEQVKIPIQSPLEIFQVSGFREKPDPATAEKFVQSFRYLWNAGIFLFRIDTMLELYKKYLPELYAGLTKIQTALGTKQEKTVIQKIYPTLTAISIDYGIIEKIKNVLVIPVDHLGWSDIGHFLELWNVLPKDKNGNVIQGKNTLVHQTTNSIIYSGKRLVACLGLNDIVVVDNGDTLFIASKQESQKLKELLKLVEGSEYKDLL